MIGWSCGEVHHMRASINLDMEDTFVDEQEEFQDKKVVPLCLNGDSRLEEEGTVSSTSQFKTEFGKVTKGISDGKLCVDTQRCFQKSCLQSQYDNEITSWNSTNFLNLNKNLAQHFCNLTKFGGSNSLGIICRAESPLSIPVNLRSSKFLLENLNHCRRTRSTNDLANFVIGYTSATGPGNTIINPLGQWIFDNIEGNDKVRNFLKGSLFFRLGDIDGNISLGRARSVDIRETNSSELTSLPTGLRNTVPEKPKAESLPFGQQRSGSKTSDKMLSSCSSTNSTCSYLSTSSAHSTVSKGLLHCIWKSGIPYFVFSVDDNRGEVYVAKPWKVESSTDQALDYMYLFHSRRDCKKESRSSVNDTLDLVAKMKVSSSLSFNSNRSKLMETEFVLFGSSEDHSKETQSSTSTLMKSKGLSKKVVDIFRTNHSSKHKCDSKIGELSNEFEGGLQEKCLDELNKLDESDPAILPGNHQPNLELAAIVVKDHRHDNDKEIAVGGWGLKFLENVTVELADTSLKSSFSSGSCQKKIVREKNKSSMSRSMNVLVPAGYHGGPITKVGGPSSLTERWRSGGHCDCGGWDIGCPLIILNDRSTDAKVLPQEGSEEDSQSVDLFTEGSKQGEPTLKMVNMREGLYFVYFQSNLSPLQSFSIAVAIIHTQTPSLSPKL